MKKILVAKPSITAKEIAYVTDAITNGWGEHCYDYLVKFKNQLKDYFQVKHAWPVSSCHGALHIVLMALGIGAGDEVIVPDSTWVGSVFPASWLGATPVFVDVMKESWCINPSLIESKITPRTKAIIVVHLYGNLCQMSEIMKIAAKYNLPVIEDAAEAIGSEYHGRKAGTIGDFGVFSFHGTKTVTTGEGGAIVSNHDDLASKIDVIDNLGRHPGKPMYWIDEIGLKYKMSNLQAALGLGQFERANELVEKKRLVFGWYKKELATLTDVQVNLESQDCKNSYWSPTLVLGPSWNIDRDKLIKNVNDVGIGIRPFFYPLSSLPMYSPVLENINSYTIYKRGINLPSYFEMTEQDVRFVTETIIAFLNKSN